MADENTGTAKFRREVDWASLPDTFTREYLRTLSVGETLTIEADGAEHLTPEQMASFKTAVKGMFPIPHSLKIPRSTWPSSVTTQTIRELSKAANSQSVAASALRASVDVSRLTSQATAAARAASEAAESHQQAFEDIAEQRRARQRAKAERQLRRDEHDALMIDLLAATSESTGALVTNAADQERRLNAQAGLTSLLSFAVVFDVVNGSFDDHTWTTSLISAGAALIAIPVVTFAGRLWAGRQK